jgi:glycine cleavage system H protein
MPTAGTIIEINTLLADEPGKVNEDPLGAGWFFKMKVQQVDEVNALMDEAAYTSYIAGLE